jgi:hypothetical protein
MHQTEYRQVVRQLEAKLKRSLIFSIATFLTAFALLIVNLIRPAA